MLRNPVQLHGTLPASAFDRVIGFIFSKLVGKKFANCVIRNGVPAAEWSKDEPASDIAI
jgi:hypothetical protein